MTTISVPINLPNVSVINTNILNNGDIILQVKSTEKGTCCKHCGKFITKYHSLNKTIKLNHLPTFGSSVFIEFQPIRYQCTDCDDCPTTTQKPSWYQSMGHCTQLYSEYIINSLVNGTIKDVSEREGISYKRIISIVNKHIPNKIDWSKIKNIEYLGIDEIALKKGTKTLSLSSVQK